MSIQPNVLRKALAEQALDKMAENARELGLMPYDGGDYEPAQQEPVAWMWKDGTITNDPDRADGTWTPLYTSPPAQRTWVGLTDEDIRQCSRDVVAGGKENSVDRFAYAIEAKLKEKNT